MSQIHSNVGPDIEITFHEEMFPERVTVAADGYSYTVFPSEKSFMYGESMQLANLARPAAETDGAVFRMAGVNDKTLAQNYGFEGSWSYFLRLLSKSDQSMLEVGSYHELKTAGWAVPVDTQEPADPEFYVVWYDANTLGEARLPVGDVFVKGLVEVSGADADRDADQIIFCGNELADRGAIAVLLDRTWAKTGALVQEAFCKQKLENAELPDFDAKTHKLKANFAERVVPAYNEILDAFRLHYTASIRQDCYLELLDAARDMARDRHVPSFVCDELKNKAAFEQPVAVRAMVGA
ncbi:hypothetical protein [Rhizobium sp. MHM7A]|uniref:hypothetical protein n=1 Tax=Rhizobium sp. MHM7A TaxID=2583233 RepID=UPI001105ADA8|nr:hypothetical protein [Rhizobium sp. MHM7A]TLX16537.1 hypothetical protein FFR93_04155 [Rhizobium sp. MHM7A]